MLTNHSDSTHPLIHSLTYSLTSLITCVIMKTSSVLLTALSLSLSEAAVTGGSGFGYDFFSRTNTKNVTLPTTRRQAEQLGWKLTRREDGVGVCREGLGVEYTEDEDTHSKNRPMSLFFDGNSKSDDSDSDARVSALSIRAWFSNSSYYNPDTWKLPAFGVLEEGERMVTVSTRDPTSVCGSKESESVGEEMLGDRLIVNVDAKGDGLMIPTTVPSTPDGAWKFGACQSDMSRHWGYPLSGDANDLYGFDHGIHVLPVIPMYSVPEGEGAGITALAFFTTEPQITYGNGGIWDATGTPAQLCSGNFCLDETLCEYGEGNSVLHVFFVDQWSATAQCGAGGSPDCSFVEKKRPY
jgi:hypothetical protein